MADLYPSTVQFPSTLPSEHGISIPAGSADKLAKTVRQLYVGAGGDVVVRMESGAELTFKNVQSGQMLGPFFISHVLPATTAADMVGLC